MKLGTSESHLEAVRSRSVLFAKYAFWASSFAFILLVGSAYLSVIQHWLSLLEAARRVIGIPRELSDPDWWLCAGLGFAVFLPIVALSAAYRQYRKHWQSRLRDIWRTRSIPEHASLHPLSSDPPETELRGKGDYLRAILSTPAWNKSNIRQPEGRDEYKRASEEVLLEIEKEVSQRALTVGLVVGVGQNNLVDLFTITAAALEIQLHVLTRLGKRPSIAAWRQMLARTASSLFLNSYLNGEESLSLRVAIRKMGLGLEATSGMIDQATTFVGHHVDNLFAADDIDADDAEHLIPSHIAGIPVKPFVDALSVGTGAFIGVGTFWLASVNHRTAFRS